MNCPHCGKPIGGYVSLDSVAYRRVQSGQCPHCGRSMPSGHRVGFASAPAAPSTCSEAEYEELAAIWRTFHTTVVWFSLLGAISLYWIIIATPSTTIGNWLSLRAFIWSTLYWGASCGISWIWYRSSLLVTPQPFFGERKFTASDMRGHGLRAILCVISAFFILVGIGRLCVIVFTKG